MKGLLIKDLSLMKAQKNFFFVTILTMLGLLVFLDNMSFVLGYLPFVISLFTISTISYDEFDNGHAFLFTLPVSRTGHTVEKYCLSLLLSGGGWFFATVIALIAGGLKGTANMTDTLMSSVMILPALLLIQAVMIPIQLKFGGEKGRIVVISAIGAMFGFGMAFVKLAEMSGIDIGGIINRLPTMSLGVLTAIILIATAIILLISMRISISIMNKKEF